MASSCYLSPHLTHPPPAPPSRVDCAMCTLSHIVHSRATVVVLCARALPAPPCPVSVGLFVNAWHNLAVCSHLHVRARGAHHTGTVGGSESRAHLKAVMVGHTPLEPVTTRRCSQYACGACVCSFHERLPARAMEGTHGRWHSLRAAQWPSRPGASQSYVLACPRVACVPR
jgi:hypothetical protein